MRLIAQRLSPAFENNTYLQGEIAQKHLVLRSPTARKKYHLYCSPHNVRADALVKEMQAHNVEAAWTSNPEALPYCEAMLIYLNGYTWTCGEASDAFADDVRRAMDSRAKLLLVHECPGLEDDDRGACEFVDFFRDSPRDLIDGGIYSTLAVQMMEGVYRATSMAMLAKALGAKSADGLFPFRRQQKNRDRSQPRELRTRGGLVIERPDTARSARLSRAYSVGKAVLMSDTDDGLQVVHDRL